MMMDRIPPVWVGQAHSYHADEAFFATSKIAMTRSGMDEFRMFQLWHMVGEAAKLPDGDILEVGCAYGGSGFVIAVRAKLSKLTSEIHLCDTFAGLVKAGAHDIQKDGEMHGPDGPHQAEVVEFLGAHGLGGINVIQGVFPENCEHLDNARYRFVHLDVDIYQSVKDAFGAVWPRMVPGGIVVIDDYGEASCGGITRFVDESLPMLDACWFLHGAFQAIAVKRGVV